MINLIKIIDNKIYLLQAKFYHNIFYTILNTDQFAFKGNYSFF